MQGYIRVGNLRANAPKSRKPVPGETVIRFDRDHPVLGNRHILHDAASPVERARVIRRYKLDLEFDQLIGGPMSVEIASLADRVIAGERIVGMCWCTPMPCHVELIIEAINRSIQTKSSD